MPEVSAEPSPLCHGPGVTAWSTAHEQMKADDTLWISLGFEGIQYDSRGGLVELRRCPRCASTLARPVSPEQAQEICRLQANLHERSQEAVESASRFSQAEHVL